MRLMKLVVLVMLIDLLIVVAGYAAVKTYTFDETTITTMDTQGNSYKEFLRNKEKYAGTPASEQQYTDPTLGNSRSTMQKLWDILTMNLGQMTRFKTEDTLTAIILFTVGSIITFLHIYMGVSLYNFIVNKNVDT